MKCRGLGVKVIVEAQDHGAKILVEAENDGGVKVVVEVDGAKVAVEAQDEGARLRLMGLKLWLVRRMMGRG